MPAIIKQDIDRSSFEIYVTDCLKILTGVNERYADRINPKHADDRTGAEIAADIIKKAGLKTRASPQASGGQG